MEYRFLTCRESFFAHLERMGYSLDTQTAYEKDLLFFERFIVSRKEERDFLIDHISKEDLLMFIDYGREMLHKPNTIARRLSTIKSFYKFLVNELDFPIDLAARVKLPKVYVPLIDILTEREIRELLHESEKLDPFYHLLFSMIYYTGSRLTPVRTLEKKNVSLTERVLYFPRVKGGRDLYLPIHHKLVNLLEVHFQKPFIQENCYVFPSKKFPSQPISAADVRLKLARVIKAAQINKRVTPHTLRHCTATHLTIKHIDQRTIASILGHTDLRSTARYQHLSIEHLRDPLNHL